MLLYSPDNLRIPNGPADALLLRNSWTYRDAMDSLLLACVPAVRDRYSYFAKHGLLHTPEESFRDAPHGTLQKAPIYNSFFRFVSLGRRTRRQSALVHLRPDMCFARNFAGHSSACQDDGNAIQL